MIEVRIGELGSSKERASKSDCSIREGFLEEVIFELNVEGLGGVTGGKGSSKDERPAVYMVWKWHNAFRVVQAKGGCS